MNEKVQRTITVPRPLHYVEGERFTCGHGQGYSPDADLAAERNQDLRAMDYLIGAAAMLLVGALAYGVIVLAGAMK